MPRVRPILALLMLADAGSTLALVSSGLAVEGNGMVAPLLAHPLLFCGIKGLLGLWGDFILPRFRWFTTYRILTAAYSLLMLWHMLGWILA